jgi:O-antigen/teichoic acid export membrane protein
MRSSTPPGPQTTEPSDDTPPTRALFDGGAAEGGTATSDESDRFGRRQIRGSGLLLTGRGFSIGLKFFAELVVVRYLAAEEYGSWAYALSAVVLLTGISNLGLPRAVARFVPIHLERDERDGLFSVLGLVLGTLVLSGSAVVATFYAFPQWVAQIAGAAPDQRLDILFIVIFLVPVNGLDRFLTEVCAAFADSRTIFVRRYILTPGFRLGVALVLVLLQADVRALAYGYLVAGVAGILYYAWTVQGMMRRRELIRPGLSFDVVLPVRRVLAYAAPVMAADLCHVLMLTAAPLMLGHFMTMRDVAIYQVVVPLVGLNKVVKESFGILFEPTASRLVARDDHLGLDRVYWRSAAWVAVLSFPAFAVSCAAAEPLIGLLYGDRYASSAHILSLLAFGMFVDATLGFNAEVLRVAGKIGFLVGVSVAAATINVALNLALIPRMGPLGAAVATSVSWVAYALLKQGALWLNTGVRPFDPAYARLYVSIAATAVGLLVLRFVWWGSEWVLLSVVAVAALAVPFLVRRRLSVAETFPELGRWPMLRRVLG